MTLPLVIVSNPARNSRRAVREDRHTSERQAWHLIQSQSRAIIAGGNAVARARVMLELADDMLRQLGEGVHVNGLRQPEGRLMSRSVRAIVYTHVEDGQFYVHGFGDAKITLRGTGDTVTISHLRDDTDVCARACPDGSVHLYGGHGQSLWEDM